jgi:hypothetical protein
MRRLRPPRSRRRWRWRVLFTLTCRFSILLSHNLRLLWLRTLRTGELFGEGCNPLKTWRSLVCYCPLSEQNVGLLSYLGVNRIISGKYTKAFKKRFIGECFLKPGAGVLDECVQDDKRADLTMYVAILSANMSAPETEGSYATYSFLRSARAASVGPDDWIRITSIRSTTPPMS